MQNKDSGALGFMAGILLGGAVGAILGLMMAQETGDKTRAKFKKTGDALIKKGREAFDQIQEDQLEPFLDKVGEKAGEVKTDIEEKFEEVKNELVKRIETTRKARQEGGQPAKDSKKTAEKL